MSLLSSPLPSAAAIDSLDLVEQIFEDDVPTFSFTSSKAWADDMAVSPVCQSEALPLPNEADEVELTHECDFSTRQPPLPPKQLSSTTLSPSAIPPLQATSSLNVTSQDVRSFVNASASSSHLPASASRLNATYNGTLVSTSVFNHELNQPTQSTPVCFNIQDLAAHHGIPQILPPAPRPLAKSNSSSSLDIPDFSTLRNNYLSMLSQRPTDNAESSAATSTVAPADLQMTPGQDTMDAFNDFFASPQELAATLSSFMSPLETPPQDFEPSPFDSPYADFLTTPVMGADDGDFLTSPDIDYGMALFGGVVEPTPASEPEPKMPPTETLYTMSPTMTPSLDVINPSDLQSISHLTPSTSSPGPSKLSSRRKSQATGTRKNLTVDGMVPLDAPTQPRSYAYPSATSRKEVPAVIAKKRARSQALGDDDDEVREAPPPPTATEKEQIEWKRRQNTLAARKSRQRKLMYLQDLEKKLDETNRELEKWKVRSQMLSHTLATHNIPVPLFDDD